MTYVMATVFDATKRIISARPARSRSGNGRLNSIRRKTNTGPALLSGNRKPTLVQKDSRRHTLAPPSSNSDDEDVPLQWRAYHLSDPPDPDDDSDDDLPPFSAANTVDYYHRLQIVHPPDSDDSETSGLAPEELVEAIIESSCMSTIDCYGPSGLRRLLANPGFTVLCIGTGTALVLLADGQHYVFLSADVDEAIRRLGPAVALSHTLPYNNGIPTRVIWVESDSDDDDPPHESSSVVPPSPAITPSPFLSPAFPPSPFLSPGFPPSPFLSPAYPPSPFRSPALPKSPALTTSLALPRALPCQRALPCPRALP
jgi:hypothetical protein